MPLLNGGHEGPMAGFGMVRRIVTRAGGGIAVTSFGTIQSHVIARTLIIEVAARCSSSGRTAGGSRVATATTARTRSGMQANGIIGSSNGMRR